MNNTRALIYLVRTRFKNGVLRFLRSLKHPGKLALVLLILGGVLAAAFSVGGGATGEDAANAVALRRASYVGILGFFLLLALFSNIGQEGITFERSDLDFLFPAPFTRTQLLMYWFARAYVQAFVIGAFLLLFGGLRFPHPGWFYVGLVLFQIVCAHMAVVAAQIGIVLADRWWPGIRTSIRWLTAIVGIGLALVACLAFTDLGSWRQALATLTDSPAARILWYPATSAVDLGFVDGGARLLPVALLVGTAVLLFVVVVRSNVDWRESSFSTSQATARRVESIKRGRGWISPTSSFASRQPPHGWRGAASIVWRDLLILRRRPRTLLGALLTVGLICVVAGTQTSNLLGPMMLIYLCMLPFYVHPPIGFRLQRDDYELYRMLPVTPMARATSMAMTTVGATWLMQVVAVCVLAVVSPRVTAAMAVGAIVAYLPINASVTLCDGWMQARNPGRTAEAMAAMSRALISMLVLAPLMIAGGITYAVTRQPVVSMLVGGAVQTAVVLVLLALTARALERRDWSAT